MNKRGIWGCILVSVLVIVLIFGALVYYYLFNGGATTEQKKEGSRLINPSNDLSTEEAISKFNESFVYYLLYSIKAYDLHKAPFGSELPSIQIVVGEDNFYATVDKGRIRVKKGFGEQKDIIIRTSKEEAVKMLRDKAYLQRSFASGNSRIELVTDKISLASRGYLKLYSEVTGKSISGNIFKRT